MHDGGINHTARKHVLMFATPISCIRRKQTSMVTFLTDDESDFRSEVLINFRASFANATQFTTYDLNINFKYFIKNRENMTCKNYRLKFAFGNTITINNDTLRFNLGGFVKSHQTLSERLGQINQTFTTLFLNLKNYESYSKFYTPLDELKFQKPNQLWLMQHNAYESHPWFQPHWLSMDCVYLTDPGGWHRCL